MASNKPLTRESLTELLASVQTSEDIRASKLLRVIYVAFKTFKREKWIRTADFSLADNSTTIRGVLYNMTNGGLLQTRKYNDGYSTVNRGTEFALTEEGRKARRYFGIKARKIGIEF